MLIACPKNLGPHGSGRGSSHRPERPEANSRENVFLVSIFLSPGGGGLMAEGEESPEGGVPNVISWRAGEP